MPASNLPTSCSGPLVFRAVSGLIPLRVTAPAFRWKVRFRKPRRRFRTADMLKRPGLRHFTEVFE